MKQKSKLSKCKKVRDLQLQFIKLELLEDDISTLEFNLEIDKIQKRLISFIMSEEKCDESRIHISTLHEQISDFKNKLN